MRRPHESRGYAVMRHGLAGLALGVILGLALVATNAGTLYEMLARESGGFGAAVNVIFGFGVIIGVGSGITGLIFEEVEKASR